MSDTNKIVFVVQAIIFIWLLRAAFKLVKKDKPKLSSIRATILYWREHLNSGDKFVITPTELKAVSGEKKPFLQFKVHKTVDGNVIDLVYPIVEDGAESQSHKGDLISLLDYFNLSHESFYDASNKLLFFFIEIDPLIVEHIAVLLILGVKYGDMELSSLIDIELIKKNTKASNERYIP